MINAKGRRLERSTDPMGLIGYRLRAPSLARAGIASCRTPSAAEMLGVSCVSASRQCYRVRLAISTGDSNDA
jgi:hypothetical protein